MCSVVFGKQKLYALIDSGADISIISTSAFTKIPSKQIMSRQTPDVHVKGATGHKLEVVEKVQLKFKLGTMILVQDFHVVENFKRSVLLGIDFLITNKATVDFGKRSLAIGNQIILLKDKHVDPDCALVHVRSRQALMPGSVNFVEVSTNMSKKNDRPLLISPLDNCPVLRDQPGVYIPSVLMKKTSTLLLPIINQTSTTIHLKRREPLGIVEAICQQDVTEMPHNNTVEEETLEAEAMTIEEKDDLRKQQLWESLRLDHLSPKYREELEKVIKQYRHLFALHDIELGQTNLVEMRLETGDHPPVRKRPYQMPFSQRPLLEKHLEDLLNSGIIRPSNSPWASPIVVVPKKDGTLRMAIDYRATANKALIPNSYPLPNIDEILSSMQGCRVFSCLDLKSGYYQISMAEDDKGKTAFVCHKGLFEFNVMPFGLSSAPPIFQELMDKVLGPIKNQFAIAYLDDILIYSKTEEEHVQHIQQIFQRLEDAGLKLKPSKCDFFKKEVRYLGHVLSADGIKPDPDKVSVIKQLRVPNTVREIRSVVGMASYYRKFIPNFSDVVKPLTELTKKNAKFMWNEKRQTAFDRIKQALASAPVLAHPDFSRPFRLYTDASLYAVGAVLTQDFPEGERVIQYLSKQLTVGQQKWPTIEREAYAIIHAVNKMRHFLLGHRFTVYTDHKPLRSLFSAEMKNARVQRWAIILDEYGCNIEYRKGSANVPADMLSRVPPTKDGDVAVVDSSQWRKQKDKEEHDSTEVEDQENLVTILDQNIKALQREDPEIENIIQSLEDPDVTDWPNFLLQDGVLYHISNPVKRDASPRLQLVIPESLRQGVLQEFHDSPYNGGHAGIDRTYDKLRVRYFWDNMYRDTVKYLDACGVCRARKMKRIIRPMQDMP